MRRVLIASLVLAVTVLAGARTPAHACSCALRPLTAESLAEADGAFVGTVVESAGGTITFRVERVFSGRIGSIVVVASGGNAAACGLEAQRGDRMGLFVRATDGGAWDTGLCSVRSPDDFAAVSAGYAPDESVPAGVEPLPERDELLSNVAIGLLLAMAAIAFAAWTEWRTS